MLYLFCGSDSTKARTKAFEWIAAARKKEPNLAYVRLAREELSATALEDAVSSSGLFVRRLLVLIDDPFSSVHTAELEDVRRPTSDVGRLTSHTSGIVEERLDALAASDNAIVILAPGLAPATAKKIVAKATKAYEFNTPARREAARGFNATLVNALAARDRERFWLEIIRALRAGDAPEMLHGLLHWKARDLIQKGGRVWGPREARTLSLDLIKLLQDSRRSGLDLPRALERFALSL